MTPYPTHSEIDELLSFLPKLKDKNFNAVKNIRGGEKDANGIIHIGFPEYHKTVIEFFKVASKECWSDYDYLSKNNKQMLTEDGFVESANIDQIKTMLTFCQRGERFCDGQWEAMIEEGFILRILERLDVIRDEVL